MNDPRDDRFWIDAPEQGKLQRPNFGEIDPLTDPIPEDQTRLGDDALTLHELARAERQRQALKAGGTVYRSPRGLRRIFRAMRRPRGN